MRLSVLSFGDKYSNYGLWQGDTLLLVGSQEEMFSIKHLLETAQSIKDENEWKEQHKQKLLNILAAPGSGNTIDDAESFLKAKMGFLYE